MKKIIVYLLIETLWAIIGISIGFGLWYLITAIFSLTFDFYFPLGLCCSFALASIAIHTYRKFHV